MTSNERAVEIGQCPVLQERIAGLAAVPGTLRRLIGERSSDDLRQPGQDGGNAVVEILCHLLDWEEITGERVWKIVNEENPELEAWDDSLWSIEHDYISRDALDMLDQFEVQRTRLVEVLGGLDEDAMQRTAELEGRGSITLQWVLEKTAKHDDEHITEISEALS